MFHRKLERQKVGQPITARCLNQIMDLLEKVANIRVTAPLAMTDTASGPLIYLANSDSGQFFPGTTGTGFSAGTPVTPGTPNSNVTVYTHEFATGWPSNYSITLPNTSGITPIYAYNIYASVIAGSKTAWYWKSPMTGNYYIITADC